MSSILFSAPTEELILPQQNIVIFGPVIKVGGDVTLMVEYDGTNRTQTATFPSGSTIHKIDHIQNPIRFPAEPPLFIPVERILEIKNTRGVVSITYKKGSNNGQQQIRTQNPKFLAELFESEIKAQMLE